MVEDPSVVTDLITKHPNDGDTAEGITAKADWDEASPDTGHKIEGATFLCESLTKYDADFLEAALAGDVAEVSAS